MAEKNKSTSNVMLKFPKENSKIKTEEEAVKETRGRIESVLKIVGDGEDRMTKYYTVKCLTFLHTIYTSFFAWRPWRRSIVDKCLLKMRFLDLVTEACAYDIEANQLPADVNPKAATYLNYGVLCSVTDCSPDACKHLLKIGIIPLLVNNISSEKNRSDKAKEDFISLNISTIHNIAKLPESREKFDAINTTEAVKYYFSWDSEKIQISALSSMAHLLSDSKESGSLLDEFSIIPKLVKCLERALENDDDDSSGHSYLGFSAEELVESLAILAVNDDNKQKIFDSGALPLLATMLASTTVLERSRAVDCLWALSFSENIRTAIVANVSCFENLEAITRSSKNDFALQHKANQALDYIKYGREGLIKSTKAADPTKTKHIFISYCWKHQEIALRIRQVLVDAGFEVWIDIDDKMHGSTLESMASAVENASLVLICYSEHYKQSNMCRTECEYVFRLGKPFVPVNMQYRYFPTGWLGIVLGARLYVDLSLEKHPWEKSVGKLFGEIRSMLKKPGENKDEGAVIQPTAAIEVGTVAPTHHVGIKNYDDDMCKCCKMLEKLVMDIVIGTKPCSLDSPQKPNGNDKLRDWKPVAVQKWLKDEGLSQVGSVPAMVDIDGPALIGLYDMKRCAPQLFYTSMLNVFDSSLSDCVRFTAALDKLLAS